MNTKPNLEALEARIRELELDNSRLREEVQRFYRMMVQARTEAEEKALVKESGMATLGPKMRTIIDRMPSMIGYWDANLRNCFSNRAYLDWFGLATNQVLGMHMRDVLGEKIYALNLPYIEGALRGEHQLFEREFPVPGSDEPRYVLAEYLPDIVDGATVGFYVQVADITALKKAESGLRNRLVDDGGGV